MVGTGRSAAWLARLVWDQEVPGSNPGAPTQWPEWNSYHHRCRKLGVSVTIIPTGLPEHLEATDRAELVVTETHDETRSRRVRWASVIMVLVAACLLAIGVVHYSSAPTRTSGGRPGSTSSTPACTGAIVKLLGVSPIPGGLGHAGLLVRTSVTSSSTCTMSGYPIVGEELTNHSTSMASDMRLGYLGGFAKAKGPLPQLSITTRSRGVSFTIQMPGCNGPRPMVKAIRFTLPGSRGALTARSMREGGIGVINNFGIYCGKPFVTPLVKGSSGDSDWR
jgi:hypothetical protein